GDTLHGAADRDRLRRGDRVERGVGDRLHESEPEERGRLPLAGTVLSVGEPETRRVADRQGGRERGAGRLLLLTGRLRAARRRDLTPDGRRGDAVREDREGALLLRAEPQDVVVREDVQRTAARILPDAHLVDERAGSADRRLEVTGSARLAVENRATPRDSLP